ncbi:phage protein GemA/Gp16 family protein [Profundibacterium mesophilum]|uniref:Regulatory protein GemA n=1 Tax=Profundibacterium mesophilum KAUST100406-0324 TaxID=1037889 RepID=A0A921NSV2_9RHOB|nr:phage protein GemA/Gp16 family protein [Profundibacterium mesophilum]KAF0674456.1 hypothetical protein PMES_03239 [Profundibacterium mesophilum KAUST100406-0324]
MSRTLQRAIFASCRTLGLGQEERRDLQLAVTGQDSLSQMDDAQMRAVLTRLDEMGGGAKRRGTRPAAPRADLRYVHVLWRLLGEDGALERPGRAGLNAFIRSRFEGKWQSVPIDIDSLRDAGRGISTER